MKIIIGLGNPGDQYKETRHNIGFIFVDMLREELGFDEFSLKKKLKSYISEGVIDGEKVVLVKPDTFMNKSGEAMVAVKNFYKVENNDIFVVYDDYDLPVGEKRMREKGSAGTHNGMRSCVELLGTEEFPRMRIGINSGLIIHDLSSYVLGRFTDQEAEKIKPVIKDAMLEIKNTLAFSGENK